MHNGVYSQPPKRRSRRPRCTLGRYRFVYTDVQLHLIAWRVRDTYICKIEQYRQQLWYVTAAVHLVPGVYLKMDLLWYICMISHHICITNDVTVIYLLLY